MTKTLLTIALAAATLPLSFAAPQASAPAAKSKTAATTQTTKKHKTHKVKKQAAAKPAAK
jgi:hypothetical protein